MKKMQHLKTLNNNKGFSLVELLVAIVVLGIIVSPMLNTFVVGAQTTAKSRKLGDATLASQNIAEIIEANNLADVMCDSSILFDAESAEFGNENDNNELKLYGIKAGTSEFNATVSINAASMFNDINEASLADYPAPDATFVQGAVDNPGNPDNKSQARFAMASVDMVDPGTMSRNITLTVDYDEDNNITAKLQYDYSCIYTKQAINTNGELVTVGSAEWTDSYTYDLLQNGFNITNGVMPNIFVLYNPWYGTKDTITVNNAANIPVSIFLVKQRTDDTSSDSEYYKSDIILQQEFGNGMAIDDNLANIYSNAKEKFGSGIVDVSYNILIKGSPLEDGKTITVRVDSDFKGDKEGDLVSKTARDRLFDVTIDVFPESDTNFESKSLTTLKTAKLQSA